RVAESRVVIHSGLRTLFDATVPLAGDAIPTSAVRLLLVAPNGPYFTRRGGSVVAGRAALLPASATADAAAQAGASAVLLYGDSLVPAGALGGAIRVPAVSIPRTVARTVLARVGRGAPVTVTIGAGHRAQNAEAGRVAGFSSTGLAFDGSVKPDIVAPGIAVPASGGLVADGSSVAAAVAAGSAALLAQTRPSLGADAIAALLVGTARQLAGDPVSAQGAGEIDVGAAAAGELASSPPTLAFGTSTTPGRSVSAAFTLTNLSSRRLRVDVAIRTQHEGAATIRFALRPRHLSLASGRSVLVHVDALTTSPPVGDGTADGAIVAAVAGGGTVRVPWALAFAPVQPDPIASASLSPSLRLTIDAGSVTTTAGLRRIDPLSRLDVLLESPAGKPLGVLARIRDVLPGRYVFQLTGAAPGGKQLAHGRYLVDVAAYPADGGQPSHRWLGFALP
ncbi:MAG TPA: S8 family serine peptidase, partial [Gaiellaceae bacterium]